MTDLDATQPRAELYGLLAELLSFPTRDLAEAVSAGEVAHVVHLLAPALPFPFEANRPDLAVGIDGMSLESEYIRLFDLPGGGPPCPLYTGVYAPARRDAMEEILRFYRFFGLTIADRGKDLPDAVPTVLEFMQVLALRADAGAAQRDLLARHLLPWASTTRSRLGKRAPGPFYAGVVALAYDFLAADCAHLESEFGAAENPQLAPSR